MNEDEAAAKNKARRSRASKPSLVGAEHVNLLDDRIASKSGRGVHRDSQTSQGNDSEGGVSGRVRDSARSSAVSMSQVQRDIASKNAARSTDFSHQDLQELDDRIAAKSNFTRSSRVSKSSGSSENVDSAFWKDTEANDLHAGDMDFSSVRKQTSFRSPEEVSLGCEDEYRKSGDGPLSPEGKSFHRNDDHLAPETTAAHGISNEPGLEYGTYQTDGRGFGDSLAVAVAVAEDEDDALIPAAIEFDPDSKPPIYRNRRFRFYFIAATILLVALGVGAALIVTSANGNQIDSPTASPSTVREGLDISQQITAIVGETKMSDPESPHARAANWINNEDPMQLPPEADNLIQRYLLALFYLATTEEKPWLSCNAPTEGENSSCSFSRLAQSFPEVVYENITWGRWLSGEHECTWAGILCDEFNQTRAIELPGQGILSTLPTEIALIPYLQSITFNWNELYGTLPSELASMKHLLNIELHYNFFTGQVPPEWYNAQALQRINYAGNWLSGTIPTEIGKLSTMKGFFTFENSIEGTLPTEIGKMKFLSFTRMGRNFLSGTLPSEVGNLEKLQEFWMHRNQFKGEMPSEMGKMKDLGDLRLHFNQFSGAVPSEHYSMPQLRRWDLYDMNLTSSISTSIGQMSKLQTYRIRGNNFFGSIPTEICLLTGLIELWLHYNDITGSIPIELCSRRGQNGILILDADCGPTNSIAPPMVQCMMECCTGCCDSVTGYCLRDIDPSVYEEVGAMGTRRFI